MPLPPSSARTPGGWPRTASASAITTTTSSSAPLEGSTIWDILLATLPPEVELELDVYWASVGGRDPVAEIGAIADRVRLLHMKDRAAGPTPHDAPVGEGTLPMPAIVEAADAAGVEWFIVEQDEPAEPLANIATSLRYLETLAD